MSEVLEDDDLKNIKLIVKGDITIKRTLLIKNSQNGGENNTEMVQTRQIINTIKNLLNQESVLINGRYLSLNKFCDELIEKDVFLSSIKYLNSFYFQKQWQINRNIKLSVSYVFKRPMWITILPSLRMFNCEKLLSDVTDIGYTYVGLNNLFQETSAVDLLPGIYVYDFRYSDDTETTETDKVVKFTYESANSAVDLGDETTIWVDRFKPYTIYYIKQDNTLGETIFDEEEKKYVEYTYKCVVMMSGIDPDVGPNTKYPNLTTNQIYYEEYYVDMNYQNPIYGDYKKAYLGTAKVFNDINREDINNVKDMGVQQPIKYWTITDVFKYVDGKFINDLQTGNVAQWLQSFDDTDTSGEFAYIFKLSDTQYLEYNTYFDGDTKPVITLALETIPQPTVYTLNEIQVMKNPK